MQITISDKAVAQVIAQMIDCNIFDNYGSDVIKAAKIPKKAELVKAVLADKKFMAGFERYITKYAADLDVMYDAAFEADSTAVIQAINACDKAYEKVDEERAIKQEAEDLKRSIRVLEAAGFKVTKG